VISTSSCSPLLPVAVVPWPIIIYAFNPSSCCFLSIPIFFWVAPLMICARFFFASRAYFSEQHCRTLPIITQSNIFRLLHALFFYFNWPADPAVSVTRNASRQVSYPFWATWGHAYVSSVCEIMLGTDHFDGVLANPETFAFWWKLLLWLAQKVLIAVLLITPPEWFEHSTGCLEGCSAKLRPIAATGYFFS